MNAPHSTLTPHPCSDSSVESPPTPTTRTGRPPA